MPNHPSSKMILDLLANDKFIFIVVFTSYFMISMLNNSFESFNNLAQHVETVILFGLIFPGVFASVAVGIVYKMQEYEAVANYTPIVGILSIVLLSFEINRQVRLYKLKLKYDKE